MHKVSIVCIASITMFMVNNAYSYIYSYMHAVIIRIAIQH